MPNDLDNRNDAKEKGRKRTREGLAPKLMMKTAGSPVDNAAMQRTQQLENFKSRINQLEEENKSSLQTIRQYAQAEIEDLKTKANDAVSTTCTKDQRRSRAINKDLRELQRRHIKLECHSRRGNLKFFEVKEGERESNNDTKTALREFLRTKLKIPPNDHGKKTLVHR